MNRQHSISNNIIPIQLQLCFFFKSSSGFIPQKKNIKSKNINTRTARERNQTAPDIPLTKYSKLRGTIRWAEGDGAKQILPWCWWWRRRCRARWPRVALLPTAPCKTNAAFMDSVISVCAFLIVGCGHNFLPLLLLLLLPFPIPIPLPLPHPLPIPLPLPISLPLFPLPLLLPLHLPVPLPLTLPPPLSDPTKIKKTLPFSTEVVFHPIKLDLRRNYIHKSTSETSVGLLM